MLVVGAACGKGDAPPKQQAVQAAEPSEGDLVRPGTVKDASVLWALQVLVPKDGNVDAAEKLARERASAAKLEVERATMVDYGWDRERLEFFASEGVDVDALAGAAAVIVIRAENRDGVALLRALSETAVVVADACHGWVIDPTYGALPAEQFRAHIPSARPDVRKLIVVHGVMDDNGLPHLDTMGLNRLGLPELYVAKVARTQVDSVTQLVNAAAQTLLERGDVTRTGQLEVDLSMLGPEWGHDDVVKAGGTGKVTFGVRWSRGDEESDAHGDLGIELLPPRGPNTEAAQKVIDDFFGRVDDRVTELEANDPALLAAGKRARDELAKLRTEVARGIPPDEQLSVKAPFTAEDGRVEWMWVDVVRFSGKLVEGTLANDPQWVTNIHSGSPVKVKFDDVADYVLSKRDGSQVGGYSIEIFRKRGLLD